MREAKRPDITGTERTRLENLRLRCIDSRMLRRIVTLLMLASGFLVKQVCQATGLTRNAIQKIRTRWDRLKFKSLRDGPWRCPRIVGRSYAP